VRLSEFIPAEYAAEANIFIAADGDPALAAYFRAMDRPQFMLWQMTTRAQSASRWLQGQVWKE